MAVAAPQWNRLEQLRRSFGENETEMGNSQHRLTSLDEELIRDKQIVIERIERIFEDYLRCIAGGRSPVLSHGNRVDWRNVTFDVRAGVRMRDDETRIETKIKFSSKTSLRNFSSTMYILSQIYYLVQTNGYSTKRNIFYDNPVLFGSQRTVDTAVDNICSMLRVPRRLLHITATCKGLIAGDFKFIDADANHVDCTATRTGVPVPKDVAGISYISSRAKLVVIVEKDATFQKLLDDDAAAFLPPTIFVTAKGLPDVNTRQLLSKIWEVLRIPQLVLADADAHGIEIMCVYRQGSLRSSYDGSLAVPAIRWIGLMPSDVQQLGIPRNSLLPLGPSDRKKLQELRMRPYCSVDANLADANFAHRLRQQLDILEQLDGKAEIQSLNALAPNFLSATFLPNKIARGAWI